MDPAVDHQPPFKPIIYASALEKGYTPASIVVDRPTVYEDPESGFIWRPENYSRKFLVIHASSTPIPVKAFTTGSVLTTVPNRIE